ncbi:MAG: B12-binding domain-containing radical SAM protein [Chitinispirillaceae bacterium]|nr:B12-binding domain-containing radical SAM protein [Chitinispirillaceae bacterium]
MNVALVFMNDTPTVGRGAGYIAGAITAAGHTVSFFDSFYRPAHEIVSSVASGKFDVLMVSTMTMNFPLAMSLVREIKKETAVPVLVGGIHPTIEGGRVLEQNPEIDYLCVGEGESMVADFLRHFSADALYDIKNLCYRRNGKVVCNPIRPPEDLSAVPEFPWHLFNKESIGGAGKGFLYITASRGCPYNCTYCCNGIYLKYYGKRYIRFRPVDKVIAELLYLKEKYPSPLYYFGDEMILAEPEYAKSIFSEVKKRAGVPYGLMARVEFITPELTAHLKETGCRYVAMGIECGDEDFRKKQLNRFHSNEQIVRAFSLLEEAGIFRSSFNIIGYPFENDNELTKSTVRLNRLVRPDYAYFTIFYPFPGTKLYDRCVKLDLIDNARTEKTRQYYEESVLKNVFLRNRCGRITRRFNSVVPFETLFEIATSSKRGHNTGFIKFKYLLVYYLKQAAKRILGKKAISWVRSRLIAPLLPS